MTEKNFGRMKSFGFDEGIEEIGGRQLFVDLISVGNVFWLPIRQSKFFGTIGFSVPIYGKILVILSPKLDILYRSLDFKYIQICRPFAPWKISYKSMEASC